MPIIFSAITFAGNLLFLIYPLPSPKAWITRNAVDYLRNILNKYNNRRPSQITVGKNVNFVVGV